MVTTATPIVGMTTAGPTTWGSVVWGMAGSAGAKVCLLILSAYSSDGLVVVWEMRAVLGRLNDDDELGTAG